MEYPSPLLATNQVMGYIRISDILWYCDLDMDHKGENMISGQNMVSGSLPIESWRAQRCFCFWKNDILDFWKPSDPIRACSRLCFFSRKHAIWDSGSQCWDSGSPPIESGHAQGCFFSGKWQSGILEPILGLWKWLTDGSGSGYIRFVIPCNIQLIRGITLLASWFVRPWHFHKTQASRNSTSCKRMTTTFLWLSLDSQQPSVLQ